LRITPKPARKSNRLVEYYQAKRRAIIKLGEARRARNVPRSNRKRTT
jgi:hypothetical protein